MAVKLAKPVALAIAIGITLGGGIDLAPIAAAQDLTSDDNADQDQPSELLPPAHLIPEGNDFSLTLHKRVNPESYREADGNLDNEAKGTPLSGVHFKLQKLRGDIRQQNQLTLLSEVADEFNRKMGSWRGADGALTPELDANFNGSGERTGITDNQGDLQFDNLEPGAYLVTETQVPIANGADVYVKTHPYIILVPTAQKGGDAWEKAVHSYPKNSHLSVSAKVDDKNKHALNEFRDEADSAIEYTLDAKIPYPANGQYLKELVIQDSYNDQELGIDDNVKPSVYRVPADGSDPVKIDEAKYSVITQQPLPTNRAGLPDDANTSFKVVINDFEAAGFENGDSVQVKFNAVLLNAADQDIVNAVNQSGIIAGPDAEQRFETPSFTTTTYIGDIRVTKVDAADKAQLLEGADFDLFRCEDDKTPENIIQSGTTGKDGQLLFEGIHVSDWVNGAAQNNPIQYCLEEVSAPSGYQKTRDTPYKVTLSVNSKEFLENTKNNKTIRRVSLEIDNISDSQRYTLPSTGGMGILLIALVGLGIIIGGVYAARRNSAKA